MCVQATVTHAVPAESRVVRARAVLRGHTHARRGNKEKAPATSNAATVSACAPRYVSQGRHVRLRTTYLYPRCFVRDRFAARAFPSVEIGRSSRVPMFRRAIPFPSAVRELR